MNPHPPLVMFPPAVAVVFCALEILQLLGVKELLSFRLRLTLSTILCISILFAYYSGFYGLDFATEISPESIKLHQGFGRFSALLSLPLMLFTILTFVKPAKPLIIVLFWTSLVALTVTLLYTAHLGGELVFEHGAGVRGVGFKVP